MSGTRQHNFTQGPPRDGGAKKKDAYLPSLIVFDLDDCLLHPEAHTLPGLPSIPIEGDLMDGQRGVVGLRVPHCRYKTTVQLYPGALATLQALATDPIYHGIVLAAASTSLEPEYSMACLEQLEVLPGLCVSDMLSYHQIGRTGHLTSDKRTHFQFLHQDSRIPFNEMLFFDDCNWGDHVEIVRRAYGVIGQRTPAGLQFHEFEQALERYRKQKNQKPN